ncbi:hypothetical protein IJ670_00595 [bacterium]|nr:hypothetical protein [bacterium]
MIFKHKISAKLSRIFAFSLIELLISLIAISCITAAFAPVISKKLMSNSISIGSTSNNNSGGGFSQDCTDISPNCQTCIGDTCLGCNTSAFECGERQYKSNLSCACINCPDYDPNCLKCDNSGCTKCPEGYYVKNGKCLNCIEGYYCSDGVESEKCPKGYQCPTSNLTSPIGCSAQTYQANEGATSCNVCASNQYSPAKASACTNCTTTYNNGCTTCTTEGCTGVQSGYYLKNNHAYPLSSLQNCSIGNSTGCTLCRSGYYLKDNHNCLACLNIAHCTACNGSNNSCTGCSQPYISTAGRCSMLTCEAGQVLSGSSCISCSEIIPGCSDCNTRGACSACSVGHYLDTSDGTCKACPVIGCALCPDAPLCSRCSTGFIKVDQICASRLEGYIPRSNCKYCDCTVPTPIGFVFYYESCFNHDTMGIWQTDHGQCELWVDTRSVAAFRPFSRVHIWATRAVAGSTVHFVYRTCSWPSH